MLKTANFFKKLDRKHLIIFGVVTSLVIGVIFLAIFQNNKKTNLISGPVEIEIISPDDMEVSGVIGIVAKAQTKLPPNQLRATFSVDENQTFNIPIQENDSETIILRTSFDTKQLKTGNHTLDINLYGSSPGSKILGTIGMDVVKN